MTQSSEHTFGDQDDAASRVASGIAGLDTILSGGFLAGGIYIVQGQPGAGKTIFGNQLCFNHARAGGRALYVTLLAENHSRMLMHIGGLSFYAEELVPERVYYVSAFPQLERNGIRGLIDLIRREVRARDVNLLVLDGLVAAEDSAGSDLAIKKFIHELQAQAAVQGCTMFLLTSSGATFVTPEHTMVDGVIALESRLYGWRAERDLQIVKRRGGGFLRGRHAYRITDDGIRVFPRIESLYADPERSETIASEPLASGIPELDGMIGGGLPQQSTTLLIGPPGCGKTTFGLQFLSESNARQPGLLLSFHESVEALKVKAESLGLRFVTALGDGHAEVIWQSAAEGPVDELCQQLLDAVQRRGVRRLYIDGYDGFQKRATDRERVPNIFGALSGELRARGVTSIWTMQSDSLIGGQGTLPLAGLQLPDAFSMAENLIAMRFVERGVDLYRMISVIKVREHRIHSRMRCFEIGEGGIVIDPGSARAASILERAPGSSASHDMTDGGSSPEPERQGG